jgi:hypothetical protein
MSGTALLPVRLFSGMRGLVAVRGGGGVWWPSVMHTTSGVCLFRRLPHRAPCLADDALMLVCYVKRCVLMK